MKAPISLLTYSSLSLSVGLLASHLSFFGADNFFQRCFYGGKTYFAVFLGFFRLCSLLFGIFLYYRNVENRADGITGGANAYFSFFSLLLIFIIPVLIFVLGAYFFALVFSLILFFFLLMVLFSSPSQHIAINLCGIPMVIFSVFAAAFSASGIVL